MFKQYIDYATINRIECTFSLTKIEFPTERFLVLALCNGSSFINDMSVIVRFDFKTKLGNIMITCDMPSKAIIFNKAKEWIYNGKYHIDGIMNNTFDDEETNNFLIDDYFEDFGYDVVKYFDIINNADDETVYSQLNASLMRLSKIMNI